MASLSIVPILFHWLGAGKLMSNWTSEIHLSRGCRDILPFRDQLEGIIQNEVVDRWVFKFDERRHDERYAYTVRIECIALDTSFGIVGEPFAVQCTDLSTSGIGITHELPLEINSLVACRLMTRGCGPLTVVAKVMWCKACDDRRGEHRAGLKFQVR